MNHTAIETAASQIARAAYSYRWLVGADASEWAAAQEQSIHREFIMLADALGYDVKRRPDADATPF